MPDVSLSEKLLADLAGWEVIKQARTILAENRVLSSAWQPPVLRGVVSSGTTSYRAGLIIRRPNDAENLCTCRQSREWGTLCAHSIAVGLRALAQAAPPSPAPATAKGPATPATPGARPAPGKSPAPRGTPHRLHRTTTPGPGPSLALQVILPPNLAEGLARGRATLFLEGQWSRGTTPLDRLPRDQRFVVGPEDDRLLNALEELAGGDSPSMIQVSAEDFATLLDALVDHPRVTLGKSHAVDIRADPWKVPLRATLEASGEITLQLRALARPPCVIPGKRLWVLEGHAIRPLGLPRECHPVLGGPVRLSRTQVPPWVGATLPQLLAGGDLEANFTAADFEVSPQPPRFHLHLAGGLASLTAHLQAAYGPRILTLGLATTAEATWMPDPNHPRRYATRDLAAEQHALQRLLRHGFHGPDPQGRFQLHGQNQVLTFFAREYPRLEREWNVTLEERLERSTSQNLERIEPRFAVSPSGEQWFDLEVSFRSGAGSTLPAQEILRLVRGGQSHTRLKNGRVALIDTGAVEELEAILVDCAPEQHAAGYRIAQSQAGFLHATLREQGWEPVAPASWRERALQQTGDVRLECPPLGDLDPILRPYQKHGVAWLHFLRRHGFGGILADEMGLGKTLQALALLATAASTPADRRLPSLVVCPTSLVFNWAEEAARFAPQLRVLTLHGPNRQSLFPRIPQSDLVITSYALIRRDLPHHRTLEFDTVILDEAQHIKNRQTQNAQAVKAVRARHRLVLTGTPLENSVLDLWSIFDFLMPGYLGSARDFRERYEMPLVRDKDAATRTRLARRIRPFLLRRLKRDVAPELPPRIDQVVWCDLTPEQSAVYTQLLDATRNEVTDAVRRQGLAQSRLLVFTALLRLRQVCCDLRLLHLPESPAGEDAAPDASADTTPAPVGPVAPSSPTRPPSPESSAKLDAFAELLEEVLDGGHRVLVFSQFTRMLALLQDHLRHADIPYAYLDGSTRDRGAVVSRFQSSPDIPVFLISLKAGGVGLNLTAADTVVHFDPWWNPAVEDQATDRAHRLGQDRIVTSYKLIARGTVEEKILRLQQRKRDITAGLLAGEEAFTDSLSWDELQDLLA